MAATRYAFAASILLSRCSIAATTSTDSITTNNANPFAIPLRNLAVAPKIVNGDDVGSPQEYPFMVSLQQGEVGAYVSFILCMILFFLLHACCCYTTHSLVILEYISFAMHACPLWKLLAVRSSR